MTSLLVNYRVYSFTFFLKFIFIHLFLAVLGLHFCARAFSSCGKWGPLFIAVRGPLTILASLVAEHRLQTHRLSSCGSRAQLLRGMWDLPRPVLEPVSPALAGRFSTTVPPGKPYSFTFIVTTDIFRSSLPSQDLFLFLPSVLGTSFLFSCLHLDRGFRTPFFLFIGYFPSVIAFYSVF